MEATRAYEQKVIGGILAGVIQPSAVDLTCTDFSDTELGQCLNAAKRIEADRLRVDADLLALRLCESGDDGFLNVQDLRLMAQAATSASVVYHAVEKIKGASLRSYLLQRCADIATQKDKTGSELLSDVRDALTSAEREYLTADNGFVYLKDISAKTKAVIDDLYQNRVYAISTGFPSLDALLLDGFSKGDAHIIVGFTGSGKSAFALNCAMNQARQGHVVGVVSREMSDVENHIRLIASGSRTPRYSIRKGLTDQTRFTVHQAIDEMQDLPIAFDTSTSNVEALRSSVRQMVERDGMAILYVDYLQLLTSSAASASRANEVQSISRTLKLIAMENKIPVVNLCQFNRGAMNATIYDILGYLKESSGIEQDASTITYVQIAKTDEPVEVRDAKLTILKNRNGATFQSIEMDYMGPVFTFSEKYDRVY